MKITGAPVVTTVPAPNNQISNNESATVAVPAVTAPKPVEGELSTKYAELAKREKILRNKIQAREDSIKAREAALAAKEAEYASNYVQKKQIRELFQKDPAKALQDFDISGDQITQGLLNQPSAEAQLISKLQAKIEQLESSIDQTKTMFKERDDGARAQAIKQITQDVKGLVSQSPEFELIKSTGSEDEVVAFLEKKFDETGMLLSIEEAASEVEKQLTEELTKYAKLSKIQSLLKP